MIDINYPASGVYNPNWRDPVANVAALPTINNNIGDVRITKDTFTTYSWNGSAWVATSGGGGGSGVTTMGAFGSTPNANGATISGTTLTLQPANASFPGGINAATYNSFVAKQSSSLTNGHIWVGSGSNFAVDSSVNGTGSDLTLSFNASAPQARFQVVTIGGIAPTAAATANSVVKRGASGEASFSQVSANSYEALSGPISEVSYITNPSDVIIADITNAMWNGIDGNTFIDGNARTIRDNINLISVDVQNRSLVSAVSENYTLDWNDDNGISINGALTVNGDPSANQGYITFPVSNVLGSYLNQVTLYASGTKTLAISSSLNAFLDISSLSRDRTFLFPDNDGTLTVGGPYVPSSGGTISGTLSIDPSSDVMPLVLNKGSGFTTDLYTYTFNGTILGGMRSDARTYWGISAGSSSISNLFVSRNPADSVVVSKAASTQTGSLFSAQSSGGSESSAIAADGRFLFPNGTVSLPGNAFLNDPDTGIYRITSNSMGFATGGTLSLTLDQNSNATFAAQILGASGSNSLPSHSFSGDPDTGIYNSTGNNIDIATNATRRLNVDANGNIRAFTLHNNATAAGSASNQDIRSGTYTPILTNTANISASTAYKAQWIRVGNVVIVSGKVDITGTVTLTSTTLGISLPIASNLANEQDLSGTAFCPTVAGNGAAILADGANDRASLKFVVTGVAADSYFYIFNYEVI